MVICTPNDPLFGQYTDKPFRQAGDDPRRAAVVEVNPLTWRLRDDLLKGLPTSSMPLGHASYSGGLLARAFEGWACIWVVDCATPGTVPRIAIQIRDRVRATKLACGERHELHTEAGRTMLALPLSLFGHFNGRGSTESEATGSDCLRDVKEAT
ncbi:hypothetical protein LIA77_05743 [Sarocladium implicatum]|nr:hypothetical protein LIA77_05743 [Sarocladium implicatum]